jgi:hypothetical protein
MEDYRAGLIAENLPNHLHHSLQQAGEVDQLSIANPRKIRGMTNGQQPRFKRKARGKGRQHYKVVGLYHPSDAGDPLMKYDVAEGTAFLSRIELSTAA